MDVRVVGLHHAHRGRPVAACVPSQQQFRLSSAVMRLLMALCLASVASNVSLSKAATQGSPGPTSSGSFTITLVIAPRLSAQTFAVEAEALPEVEEASAQDDPASTTAPVVQTAAQVLSESQAIRTAEANSNQKANTEPADDVPVETEPINNLRQKLCIKGNGMSHYSLKASGSRTDNHMVLSSDSGGKVPYQVVLTDKSAQAPINLQKATTLPLNNKSDCSKSPVVSINLTNSARSNLQNNRYFGAAQVTVSAE